MDDCRALCKSECGDRAGYSFECDSMPLTPCETSSASCTCPCNGATEPCDIPFPGQCRAFFSHEDVCGEGSGSESPSPEYQCEAAAAASAPYIEGSILLWNCDRGDSLRPGTSKSETG